MPLSGPRLSTNQASKIHLKFKMEDSYNEFDVCFLDGVAFECFVKKIIAKKIITKISTKWKILANKVINRENILEKMFS